MFDSDVRCLVVVGSQWGDEGKGKIVDVLAGDADWIVRYQGGANAGHTVRVGDDEFILHQVPSGVLHPGKRAVLGNGVVLDPVTFFEEIAELERRGHEVSDRILVSPRAHLVLPYHKLLDQAEEANRGSAKLGTTGRGIGAAYQDKVARVGVRVADLGVPERLRELVEAGAARARVLLGAWGSDDGVDAARILEELQGFAPRLLALTGDVSMQLVRALRRGERVLMEGAQGAMLDVDHGTYPFVTSSQTTAGGAAVGAGIGPTAIDAVLGVVKAYTTRVGNGPFPTELDAEGSERLRQLGGEFGATTGRPRRTGWFDVPVVQYASRINGLTALAISKLDVLDTFEEIRIAVGYRLDGQEVETFPDEISAVERLEPIYETMNGWKTSTSEARKLSDLPGRARDYLGRIAELTRVPIRYVSVGTRREQIIEVLPQ